MAKSATLLTITIKLENAVFRGPDDEIDEGTAIRELTRILTDFTHHKMVCMPFKMPPCSVRLQDLNGNTVGRAEIT